VGKSIVFMIDAAKDIAKTSKSSFYYAFNLLPEEKREAMNTVYAFCRKTDDIIDEGNETEIRIIHFLINLEEQFTNLTFLMSLSLNCLKEWRWICKTKDISHLMISAFTVTGLLRLLD